MRLISDRIFIDESALKEISNMFPASAPVMTYLGNKFDAGKRSTPYSFVSALPSSLYPEIAAGNGMIINRWMANDLLVREGDTIKMYWYSPDSLNKLIEKSSGFIVKHIVDMVRIWADSLLMPDFPGISGKESCSEWDAGVPIKMNKIRAKDEDYWNKYRGTPKAFISYEKGKELWGNNFGPATAIRYPACVNRKEIEDRLNGSLDPEKMGFNITDLLNESVKAANESVDFGTLFLSLGFFLILASLVLLSFAVSSYFNSKSEQINTLFALGFKNKWITQQLFFECGLISIAGCLAGVFAGYLVNIIITRALNTVWNGAVQTDTLETYFNLVPMISGFIITFLTIMIFTVIKVKRFLNGLNNRGKEIHKTPSANRNFFILIISSTVTISLFVLSLLLKNHKLSFSFTTGMALLLTFVILWRQFYIGRFIGNSGKIKNRKQLSHRYYSLNPSNAVTPILFIAAGIFTVFVTGANRMSYNEKQNLRSGGTGGYLLWCENTIPVYENLNTKSGRKTIGLDDDKLSEMSFVQMKKSSGNDASCLNLNHITVPPILGIDPDDFIAKKSFSFSKIPASDNIKSPWEYLNISSANNTIFGIADQTVLDWGLKLKRGDTLVLRAENGQNIEYYYCCRFTFICFSGLCADWKEKFRKILSFCFRKSGISC